MEPKYQILWDYHSEGYRLDEAQHDSVDEAVKDAVGRNYAIPFIIIKVYWRPN